LFKGYLTFAAASFVVLEAVLEFGIVAAADFLKHANRVCRRSQSSHRELVNLILCKNFVTFDMLHYFLNLFHFALLKDVRKNVREKFVHLAGRNLFDFLASKHFLREWRF